MGGLKNMQYAEYLQSYAWKILRARAIDRAHGICEFCHKRIARNVHHVQYPKNGYASDSLENVVAVCVECHNVAHGIRQLEDKRVEWGMSEEITENPENSNDENDIEAGICCGRCGFDLTGTETKREPGRRYSGYSEPEDINKHCPGCGIEILNYDSNSDGDGAPYYYPTENMVFCPLCGYAICARCGCRIEEPEQ
jgi:hypothetical protein